MTISDISCLLYQKKMNSLGVKVHLRKEGISLQNRYMEQTFKAKIRQNQQNIDAKYYPIYIIYLATIQSPFISPQLNLKYHQVPSKVRVNFSINLGQNSNITNQSQILYK